MVHVPSMLKGHPKNLGGLDEVKLAACIAACFERTQTCTAGADAYLSEDMVAEIIECIHTNLDCADLCATTGKALSWHTGSCINLTRVSFEACRTATKVCAEKGEKHAKMHEHCRICAVASRCCKRACKDLISSLD